MSKKNELALKMAVEDIIKNLDNDSAVSLWNEYCDKADDMEDYIYDMDVFDNIMDGKKPWEVVCVCFMSENFWPTRKYFWFNSASQCESSDYPATDSKSPFYAWELAEWIVDNDDALGNHQISDILDN